MGAVQTVVAAPRSGSAPRGSRATVRHEAGRVRAGDEQGLADGRRDREPGRDVRLRSAQGVEVGEPALADREVRDDVGELAAVREPLRERAHHGRRQRAERVGGLGVQPEDVVAEPSRAPEHAPERGHARDRRSERTDQRRVELVRGREREQHGDVRRDAPAGGGVEGRAMASDDRLRLGHGHDHRGPAGWDGRRRVVERGHRSSVGALDRRCRAGAVSRRPRRAGRPGAGTSTRPTPGPRAAPGRRRAARARGSAPVRPAGASAMAAATTGSTPPTTTAASARCSRPSASAGRATRADPDPASTTSGGRTAVSGPSAGTRTTYAIADAASSPADQGSVAAGEPGGPLAQDARGPGGDERGAEDARDGDGGQGGQDRHDHPRGQRRLRREPDERGRRAGHRPTAAARRTRRRSRAPSRPASGRPDAGCAARPRRRGAPT